MISCVLYSIYLWLEDLQCAFLHQIFIGIKTFYSYPLFENVYYWAACGAQLWNGLSLSKKDKPRRRWVCHSPFNAPICAGRGRVISGRLANRLESRFGTNTKLLRGVNWPYISIQYSMMLLVCAGGSRSNNALPWSPREILQLLLRVKSLAVQERNMLFVDRLVKQKHGHLSWIVKRALNAKSDRNKIEINLLCEL